MRKNYIPHGTLLESRVSKDKNDRYLSEMHKRYLVWSKQNDELDSDVPEELKEKVKILNEYKNFVDNMPHKQQDKLPSSVMEEFLFYLFKDCPFQEFSQTWHLQGVAFCGIGLFEK